MNRFSLLACLLFSLFLFGLANAQVVVKAGGGSSVLGSSGSWLNQTPYGVFYSSPSFSMNATTWFNNKLFPPNLVSNNVSFQSRINQSGHPNASTATFQGFKWEQSPTLNLTSFAQMGLLNILGVTNLAWNYSFSTPFRQVGTGILQVDSQEACSNELRQTGSCTATRTISFGDVFTALSACGLTASEVYDANQTDYVITSTGYSLATLTCLQNGLLKIDPQITEQHFSQFNNGAFNATYTNDSASVFTQYFPNNNSFAPNGSFFSQILVLNHTNGNVSVNTVNWSWFEAAGFGNNETTLLSLHFENDTKDSSRYNVSKVVPGTVFISQPNCVIGQCLNGSYITPTFAFPSTGTFSFWFYTQGLTFESEQSFITGACDTQFWLHAKAGNNNVEVYAGGTQLTTLNLANYNRKWTQLVWTNDGASNKIYLNGTQVFSGGSANWSASRIQIVGSCGGGANQVSFDEMHLFNRSFSASEVSQLYNWERGGGTGNAGFIHNFTNVSVALRTKNYTFNDSGLVGWWDLGDSSDNEALVNKSLDLSGYNNAGIFPVVSVKQETNCVIGNCLTFNSSAAMGWLDLGSPAILNFTTSNFSISLWGKKAVQGSTFPALIERIAPPLTDNDPSILLVCDIDCSNISWEIINSTPAGFAVTTAFNSGWQHFVGVYNGTHVIFYVNGSSVGQAVTVGTPQLQAGWFWRIADYRGGRVFNGSIDDVKIWNRTLSASEVTALYNAGNPTNATGQERNWTAFSSEYYGGNASVTGVVGNLLQYRASLTAQSTNYTAFFQNITIVYSLLTVPSPGPNVTLIAPANNSVAYGSTFAFNFTPNSTDGTFGNATLFGNFSGSWAANFTNRTALVNGSVNNNITVAGLKTGAYVWNVRVCDNNGCGFAQSNNTFSVERVPALSVTLNSPANASNSSNNSFVFSYTPTISLNDSRNDFANASLWIANVSNLPAGVAGIAWGSNQTVNTTIVVNNSANTITVRGLPNGVFVWNVNVTDQECEGLLSCLFPEVESNFSATNFTFTIDSANPLATIQNAPVNNSNQSSLTIAFNFTPLDALSGISNTTLFVWNTSSGQIANVSVNSTGIFNGTPVLVSITLAQGVYNWTVQACDFANNCFNTSYGNVTLDNAAPKWFNNGTNGLTGAGQALVISVNWTDNIALSTSVLQFDNGSGTFTNYSRFAHAAYTLTNWSNFTVILNSTVGSIIRWQVFTNDTTGNQNATAVYSLNTTDATPPLWFNPSTNSTLAGSVVNFTVRWTDNYALGYWIFSLDNGNGSFTNDSGVNFTGTANVSFVARQVNSTPNTTIRWLFFGVDSSGNMNATSLQSFGGISDYFICTDGTFPANKQAQQRFTAKNATNLITSAFCQVNIFAVNSSFLAQNINATEVGGGVYNYSFNLPTGVYVANVNCSINGTPVFADSQTLKVVNTCTLPPSQQIAFSNAGGGGMTGLEFGLTGFMALLAGACIVIAVLTRNKLVFAAAGVILIFTGFMLGSNDPNIAITSAVTQNSTTNLMFDASNNAIGAGTNSTLVQVPLHNTFTNALEISLILLGLGLLFYGMVGVWQERNQPKAAPERKSLDLEEF